MSDANAPKKQGTIRMQFTLRYADAGFEKLHKLLAPMSAHERSSYIKNALLALYKGFAQPDDNTISNASVVSKSSHSLSLSISWRDAGLEELYKELCELESSLDRSRHIRQKLLNALTFAKRSQGSETPNTAPTSQVVQAAKVTPIQVPLKTSIAPAKRDYGEKQFD